MRENALRNIIGGDFMQPFEQYELRTVLQEQLAKIKARIDNFTDDEIMANDLRILAHNVCEEFRIDPLELHEEDAERRDIKNGKIQKWFDPVRYFMPDRRGAYREVDGVTLTFVFPFSGTAWLFECQASHFYMSRYPEMSLGNGEVNIQYQYAIEDTKEDGWKEKVLRRLDEDVRMIKQGIEWVNADVTGYNLGFAGNVLSCLEARRSKIETYYHVAKMFDVSVKKNAYGSRIISPVKRTIYPIAHQYGTQERTYCIEAVNYEEILAILKNAGATMERTPNSYRYMGEEDLRNVLLASLNASFKGIATGEAFRNNGKTDICIEAENRAAFVAECKMWTGEKEVSGAIAQLDSYLTWRDCKTALIYWVRRKDFLSVAKKMESVLENQGNISQVSMLDTNEYKCFLVSTYSPGQRKEMRVLMFNLSSDVKGE